MKHVWLLMGEENVSYDEGGYPDTWAVRVYTDKEAAQRDCDFLNDAKELKYLWHSRRAQYSSPTKPSASRRRADFLIAQRQGLDHNFAMDYFGPRSTYHVRELAITDAPLIPIEALVSELTK